MPNLPPGPWKYRPDRYDDWGWVRDADGNVVADTCPVQLIGPHKSQHAYNTLEYHAGPPQARAVAELLIRAEREADETPASFEWLVSVGMQDWWYRLGLQKATRGKARKLAAALGVTLNEGT